MGCPCKVDFLHFSPHRRGGFFFFKADCLFHYAHEALYDSSLSEAEARECGSAPFYVINIFFTLIILCLCGKWMFVTGSTLGSSVRDFVKRFSDGVFALSADSRGRFKCREPKGFKSWVIGKN